MDTEAAKVVSLSREVAAPAGQIFELREARATTEDKLLASIDKLAEFAERG